MSSGFVSSNQLDEERKQRQEEWEKVRKPEDPQLAPEQEVCNKTLFEQLRDNKEAKQAEIDEAKKFKNMIRGIDDDESDFLSQVDEMKAQALKQNKKEEEELLKEMASTRHQAPEAPPVKNLAEPAVAGPKPVSKQASILSAAIKRKPASENDSVPAKAARQEAPSPAVSAMKVIGSIPGMGDYEASSDSDSNSSDSDVECIPMLQVTRPEKKSQEH